ncbi:MAG: hypothetical protein LCH53_12035 [Bacteroidetes bacterium]|nr:hypothetical protein [Bacteroidota bacterium]
MARPSDDPRRVPARQPADLTPLGQVVYGAGFVARLTALGLDAMVDRIAETVVRSEKAFREGRDGVDDARIVRETHRPPRTTPHR